MLTPFRLDFARCVHGEVSAPLHWVRAAPRPHVHLAIGAHVGPAEVRWEPWVLGCPLGAAAVPSPPAAAPPVPPPVFLGQGLSPRLLPPVPVLVVSPSHGAPLVGVDQPVLAGTWLTFYKHVVRTILQPPWIF